MTSNLKHARICTDALIKLKELYNFVVIEAIQDTVHIVPRFDKTNEYFVNKFIF